MGANVGFHELVAGVVNREAGVVMFFGGGHQFMGFGRQATGVEAEHFQVRLVLEDQVRQDHVFGAKAVGEDGGGKLRGDFFEQEDDGACFCSRLASNPALSSGWVAGLPGRRGAGRAMLLTTVLTTVLMRFSGETGAGVHQPRFGRAL